MVCVLYGDSGAGKTCLIKRFSGGEAITENDMVPRTADNTVKNFSGSQISRPSAVSLLVHDTDGALEIRKDEEADVIIICFDIVKPDSLEKAKSKWAPGVKAQMPGKPLFLVGCKSDMRGEKFEGIEIPSVSNEQATAAASEMGAVKYFEFSARADGVDPKEIFLAAVIAALPPPPKAEGGCCVVM